MARIEDLDRPLFMEERRSIILELLAGSSTVRVSELAARFGVSPATIRTDIRQLEAEGKLQRTHGGAIATEGSRYPVEMSMSARRGVHKRQKARIAQEAAKIVSDNDFLLVDSGSTTQAFVAALVGKRHLTILTNDIVIANFADEKLADATCILLGGVVRAGFQNTQGTETVEMLRNYHAPYLFTSSDVFTIEHGLSTFMPEQAALKRAMYEQADSHVALLDSSKFGKDAPAHISNLSEIEILVSDAALPDDVASRIRSVEDAPELRLA